MVRSILTKLDQLLLFLMNPPQSIDYEALKDLKEDGDGYLIFVSRRIMVMGSFDMC